MQQLKIIITKYFDIIILLLSLAFIIIIKNKILMLSQINSLSVILFKLQCNVHAKYYFKKGQIKRSGTTPRLGKIQAWVNGKLKIDFFKLEINISLLSGKWILSERLGGGDKFIFLNMFNVIEELNLLLIYYLVEL